jgi:hypothetical protein
MMRLEPTLLHTKQLFSLLLGAVLSLAIFISPYQLHNNPASIFTNTKTTSEHQHHSSQIPKDFKCLRCVLQSFQLPETIAPLLGVVIVLGFVNISKTVEPFSFILPTKAARAPPVVF